MKYCERGKINPFDAYTAGCSIWFSPRQILILNQLLVGKENEIKQSDLEAYRDMLPLIKAEAEIKRKKYLGG